MHDVRETVDAHQLLHLDRAGSRHPSDVVAREIHQHHVLRTLFLRGSQIGLVRGVLSLGLATWTRARDGMHDDLSVLDAYERLRRGTDERRRGGLK